MTRVGDETVGEMWSLFDGQDILNEVDPQFSANIRRHIHQVIAADPFHVSANTDPKGDRSKPPQDQDPDMLLHVVKETDAGIVVRGAKYETAAAYANQAFTKPTIANWGSSALSDYAVGFVCDLGSPNLKFICRTGFAGRAPAADYPLANRFDEVDALVIFDDVLIPWENVPFLQAHAGCDLHPRDAAPLLGVRVRAAQSQDGRHDDRCGAVQREADRPRQAAGGAGQIGAARGVPRGHQCASHRVCRARGKEPLRTADAESVPCFSPDGCLPAHSCTR